ncbi:MAG: T9SS type A sorting domain-containing protein [Saprospiraceae bacterium]|nr:T9SS type A sorting domain-containing protein [Saprospiraceae bacterium]
MNVELVDFDGDKDLEIILEDAFSGVYIFKNIDNFKTFEAISDNSLSFVSQPLIVKAFDFNYDKLMDIVVLRQTQNTLYVDYYEATSQYKFKLPRQIMTFLGGVLYGTYDGTAVTRNMNFVDINSDGKMDITVTAGFDKKQIAVLNTTILSSNNEIQIDKFSINPNILVDDLSLELPENSLINIFNSTGQLVLSQDLIGQSINISSFRSGAYFLQVLSKEGKLSSSRFIKVD